MAGVKKKDIPDIAAFMPEFWEFVKSVWIPEDSDQYWNCLLYTSPSPRD